MADFTPDQDVTGPVDTRYLVAWQQGFTIDEIISYGTIAEVSASGNSLRLTYIGPTTLTEDGNAPTGGTIDKVSYGFDTGSGLQSHGFLIDISPAVNFADITTINAYRIFDGSDTINGTAFGGDNLFAGYGGNDVLDGKGGGDNFLVPVRAGIPSLTIKGVTGASDTLFVLANIYDTSATFLDLRGSTLTSINAVTLDPGGWVIVNAGQLGAGISAGAVIGATSGTAIFDVFKDFDSGTLDLQGKLDVNPNTMLRIFGTDTAETLSGTDRADTFYGKEGADTLNGRGGNDTFWIEGVKDEFDTINGGSGIDTLRAVDDIPVLNGFNAKASSIEVLAGYFSGNAGANTFDLRGLSEPSGESLVFGADGDDTLMAPDFLFGLFGGNGKDTLIGGKGGDFLAGQLGADTLTGGGDADAFFYYELAESGPKKSLRDTITDFDAKKDGIGILADANVLLDDVQRFTFVKKEGAGFKKKPGSIIWEQIDKKGTAKDMTIVYADANGDKKADFALQLKGLVDLKADDFLI